LTAAAFWVASLGSAEAEVEVDVVALDADALDSGAALAGADTGDEAARAAELAAGLTEGAEMVEIAVGLLWLSQPLNIATATRLPAAAQRPRTDFMPGP
jgi:hypothetical protein